MKILVVIPSGNGKFDGACEGEWLVRGSATPFCTAARILLTRGVNPDVEFVMRHSGSDEDALKSTVGKAAEITVEESGRGPRFREYRPYGGPTHV